MPPAPSAAGPGPELFDQDGSKPRRTLHGFLITLGVLAVAALVAVAALLFRQTSPPSYPVEGLVGSEVGEARNRIATYGWDVSEVREKNDTQPLDVVFKTDPSSGEVEQGKPFVLYVSDGPTPSVLPPLVGQSVDVATAALAQLQLTLVPGGEQFSETIPAGTIMAFTVAGQQVPEGAEVDKGSTVSAIISAGPEPRTIPPLAGLPPDQAEQALRTLGLVPSRGEDVFDIAIAPGLVAVATPPQGTQVPRDSTVVYQVSKGQGLVIVPILAGQNLQQATATLAANGLAVGALVGDSSKPVAASTPAAGTTAPRGSAISLTFFP